MLRALRSGAVVCNIGHFDNEIDTAYMREGVALGGNQTPSPQSRCDADNNDHLLLLSEGRLVNLGNATGSSFSESWMVPSLTKY
jgi:adenosylhomocysteinase